MSTDNITDKATAAAALNRSHKDLARAIDTLNARTGVLRDLIVRIRPAGTLTVDEMAEAVGRTRNYIDSIWSSYGGSVKGKQTRVPVRSSDETRESAVDSLSGASAAVLLATDDVARLRAERVRLVALVYGSKVLGPSAIAAESGIDRNHVLRTARKAGLTPAWRAAGTSRNQHTVSK